MDIFELAWFLIKYVFYLVRVLNVFLGISYIVFIMIILTILIPSYYRKIKSQRHFAKKNYRGSWAILAGSYDELYLSFVKHLIRRGCNLYLISDDNNKLEQLKSDLHHIWASNNMIKTCHVDFEIFDIELIKNQLKNLGRISLFMLKFNEHETMTEPGKFVDSDKIILKDIKNKLIVTTKLAKLAMSLFDEQGHGVLINVSSMTSILPVPLLSLSSAFNSYLDYLGRCLCYEKTCKDTWVLNVKTLNVPLLRHRYKQFNPDHDKYVDRIFKSIGYTERTTAYFYYDLLWFFLWEVRNWNKVLPGVDLNSKVALLILKRLINKN